MGTQTRLRKLALAATGTIVAIAATAVAAIQDTQQTSPPKQGPKGAVIRGCLTGSNLIHLDPQNLSADLVLKIPDKLKVTSARVIRDQVKALNGHQVEITGSLRGIPGMETGMLVVDSDNGKLYLGGDPKMGSDMSVKRNEPPTINAQMIKDVAATCSGQPD